jgi:hypothetical protein
MDVGAIVDTGYHLTFRCLCACGAEYIGTDRDGERFGLMKSKQCPACRWPSRGMLDLGIAKIGIAFADGQTLRYRRTIWFRDGQTAEVAVQPGTTTL